MPSTPMSQCVYFEACPERLAGARRGGRAGFRAFFRAGLVFFNTVPILASALASILRQVPEKNEISWRNSRFPGKPGDAPGITSDFTKELRQVARAGKGHRSLAFGDFSR